MNERKRKLRKDARDWTGASLTHGVVECEAGIRGDHTIWRLRCNHCGGTHDLTVKQLSADVWTNKCPEFRAHNSKGFENHRDAALRRDYGITLARYRELHQQQGGKCAICGAHQDSLPKSLAVDHCHTTGKVRGLLCYNCNRGLGHFKDSIQRLATASVYLTR